MNADHKHPVRRFLSRLGHAGLRSRLMLLVGLCLLPAILILFWTALAERDHVMSEARNSAMQVVRAAAREQNILIDSVRQQLLTLAQLPIVRRPDWGALCSRTFTELRRQHPHYANLGVADRRGQLRCSAVAPLRPLDFSDRDYVRLALAKDGFALGRYQTGRITGRISLYAGYPVRDERGAQQAVVFAAIDLLSWLNNLAETLALGDGAVLMILNDQGKVLAHHPDPERWLNRTLPDAPLVRHVLSRRGEGNIETAGLDGVLRLQVFTPIHASAGEQAWLIAGLPSTGIYRDVNRSLLSGLAILAVLTLAIVSLGWFGADYLVLRPVQSLTRMIRELGGGNLAARTNLSHTDGEIDQLGASLDGMAENLEKGNLELRRVNRALRMLSAGNRTMLRTTDEQTLLDEMCRTIVQEGDYPLAMVLYREAADSRALRPMAEAGFPGGLAALRALHLRWADDDCGRCPGGTAARNGQTCIVTNRDEPPCHVWHEAFSAFPYSLSIPLSVRGEPLGTLVIGRREAEPITREELQLIEESAQDLAFGIESLRTRAAHHAANQALRQIAQFDPLTGLPNEAYFVESLAAEIDSAERQGRSFAVLQLDIERLREINDALGFGHGDDLLRQVGERLRGALPPSAQVARLRADEFAALLPDVEGVAETVRRIGSEMAKSFNIADIPLDITSHIGIVRFPDHGTVPHDLLRHMDMAMHLAKRRGVDHAVFDPSLDRTQPQRLVLASELRRAIENGDLLLYLQPKVEIADGRIGGAEALVRWQHAQRGMIPPGEFIDLAEHTGLIRPLTEWVIEAALKINHDWQASGDTLPIAVNLSARNLREEALLDRIRRLQATWKVATGLLEFEITESAVMEDAEFALQVLHRLRDHGIPLYIDDFGTGYSSLGYLQKLPVETIKIDQSFVRSILTSKDAMLIVRSTIDLSHDLGRRVVAEGVETREIWDRLAALGCDIAQGYFIARPMPVEEFPAWRKAYRPPMPDR